MGKPNQTLVNFQIFQAVVNRQFVHNSCSCLWFIVKLLSNSMLNSDTEYWTEKYNYVDTSWVSEVQYKIEVPSPTFEASQSSENLAATKLPKMVNCVFEDIFEPQPNSITGWDSYSATYVKEKPDIIWPGFAQNNSNNIFTTIVQIFWFEILFARLNIFSGLCPNLAKMNWFYFSIGLIF